MARSPSNFAYLLFFLLFLLSNFVNYGDAFVPGLYCGEHNCYDVLSVSRNSERSEIAKAYRKLARKYHPDKYKEADAEEKFQLIATAYEILKDEEERENYDYMLDHPEMYYQHYYRYYKKRVTPKVDPKIVVAVTITVISVIQYYSWWTRYHSAVDYLMATPKYRIKAMDMARQEGLLNNTTKKKGRRSKEEAKEEEEKIIRKIIEDNTDIRGGYRKPSITDVLWVQVILLPVTIAKYSHWFIRWHIKFTICREPYGIEEKDYLIRRNFGLSVTQYESIEESERETFHVKELWIKDRFVEYKKEKEEEMKAKLAENNKYKSYRRYMKNHGTGRMTFQE